MGVNNSKTSPVVDLEDVLKSWAWTMFLMTQNKNNPDNKLKISDVEMEVVWDKVHFTTSEPAFGMKQGPIPSLSQLVFKAEYENKTTETQEQNFATTRTTVAKATTVLTRGFTRGVHTDIKVTIPPEVAYATSGFGNEVMIKTDEVNTVSYSLTWTTNSTIKLPPKTKTLAHITVNTEQFQCDFSAFVTFKGTVLVRILDNRSGNLIKMVENDISTILKDELERRKIKFNTSNPESITINGKTIQWPISGELRFKYGVTQHVDLENF